MSITGTKEQRLDAMERAFVGAHTGYGVSLRSRVEAAYNSSGITPMENVLEIIASGSTENLRGYAYTNGISEYVHDEPLVVVIARHVLGKPQKLPTLKGRLP